MAMEVGASVLPWNFWKCRVKQAYVVPKAENQHLFSTAAVFGHRVSKLGASAVF